MRRLSLVIAVWCVTSVANPTDNSPSWKFDRQVICANVPGADEVVCGDIDGDGRIDILCAQSEGQQLPLRWFKNLGGDPPRWKISERISPVHADWQGEEGWMGSWLGDLDGDGDLDVVSGAKGTFSGVSHPVFWFENLKGDGSAWAEHLLPVNGDYIDNSRTADLNADGRDDLIIQKYHGGGVHYVVCPAPADARRIENWRSCRIGEGGSGLCLADIDGDRCLDVLVNNQWLRNPGQPAQERWPAFSIADAPEGVKNAAGDFNRDGRMDIVLSSEEGKGIWWFEATAEAANGKWIRHPIVEDYMGVHTLWVADFDRNGRPDILAAEMHTKGKHRVTIFQNADGNGQRWVEHTIATTGSHNAVACDVNGDGMPDVVGCNFADSDNPLEVWYNSLRAPLHAKTGGK
ncbi:MAG: VCBS repeat-containing protein [bacterium]|nr:VCBS repeat-containing protein [bacterium]